MRPTPTAALSLVLAAAACLGLSACATNPDETAAACPEGYKLPDAATLARYRGAGRDLSDLIVSARLIDAKGGCVGALGAHEERLHLHVVMLVSRGPAAQGPAVDIPYGVGVMRDGAILQTKNYVEHVVFPPNVNTVQVAGQELPLTLPTRKGVTGPSYHLYFWLQLTPQELAENRRQG